jgi:hypothetical protein
VLPAVGIADIHLGLRTVHDDQRRELRVVACIGQSDCGKVNVFWYNHTRSVADYMPLMKDQLIPLVRLAQRETNPRRREVLWQLVREAGIPADATIINGEYIGEQAPLLPEPEKDILEQ